jgi:ABC-type histidine transport system ATPase subunit
MRQLATRVVFVRDGRIARQGTPAQILEEAA